MLQLENDRLRKTTIVDLGLRHWKDLWTRYSAEELLSQNVDKCKANTHSEQFKGQEGGKFSLHRLTKFLRLKSRLDKTSPVDTQRHVIT